MFEGASDEIVATVVLSTNICDEAPDNAADAADSTQIEFQTEEGHTLSMEGALQGDTAVYRLEIEQKMGSLDFLIPIAKSQIEFHRKFVSKKSRNGDVSSIIISDADVKKYEYFMTMQAKLAFDADPEKRLRPPLDEFRLMFVLMTDIMVQMLWRIHMMNPFSYYNDCMVATGHVIPFISDPTKNPHNLLDQDHIDDRSDFGTGFFVSSTDLKTAFNDHKVFIAKILSIFNNNSAGACDPVELDESRMLNRYYQFLYLKMKLGNDYNLQSTFVARMDMDLMLRSHQLVPSHYYTSFQKLFGVDNFNPYLLIHKNDDNNNLVNHESQTQSLWNKYFGSGYKDDCLAIPSEYYNNNDDDIQITYTVGSEPRETKNTEDNCSKDGSARLAAVGFYVSEAAKICSGICLIPNSLVVVFLYLLFVGFCIFGLFALSNVYEISEYDTTIWISNNLTLHCEVDMQYDVHSYIQTKHYNSIALAEYNVENFYQQVDHDKTTKHHDIEFKGPHKISDNRDYESIEYRFVTDESETSEILPFQYKFSFGYDISFGDELSDDPFCRQNDNLLLQLPWFNSFVDRLAVKSTQLNVYCHADLYADSTSAVTASTGFDKSTFYSSVDINTTTEDYILCYQLSQNKLKSGGYDVIFNNLELNNSSYISSSCSDFSSRSEKTYVWTLFWISLLILNICVCLCCTYVSRSNEELTDSYLRDTFIKCASKRCMLWTTVFGLLVVLCIVLWIVMVNEHPWSHDWEYFAFSLVVLLSLCTLPYFIDFVKASEDCWHDLVIVVYKFTAVFVTWCALFWLADVGYNSLYHRDMWFLGMLLALCLCCVCVVRSCLLSRCYWLLIGA